MTKKYILIILLLAITIYTRFVNLNWDRGWGFHPDENNLWGASRTIKWFSNLDPKFYAYGGFPIYLYSLFNSKVEARVVSALLQTGIIGLLFLTGRKLKGAREGFLAAVIGIFSAGLIQASHFLTVESLIGFFGLMILFSLLKHEDGEKGNVFWMLLAAVILGLGIGTKISFAVFALPFVILLRPGLGKHKAGPLLKFLLTIGIVASIFFLTNSFIFSKFQDVKSTLKYETNVAMGKMPVFYTRQFTGTVSGWFQIVHIFPFITSWVFVPVFLVGIFVVSIKIRFWKISRSDLLILLIIISSLLSFLPMWAKWTRYVVQVLPILILISAIGADWLWEKGKTGKAVVVLLIISFLPQFFSVMKVYGSPDNRLTAADWAAVNIPKNAKIFTEGMDLGIIPFNPIHGENITLFNFYELDEDKTGQRQTALNTLINENEYFISVSNRVYGNSLRSPDKFPASADFYRRLFDGSLGYKKIAEFPVVNHYLLPFTRYLLFPEETFRVFDSPILTIFHKKI